LFGNGKWITFAVDGSLDQDSDEANVKQVKFI
jgi:hypothetical protein